LGDAKTSPWLKDPRVGVIVHLEEFRSGGSFLIRKSVLDARIAAGQPIGRSDGLFIVPRSAMDKMLSRANGDIRVVEKGLGIPEGVWSEPMVRVDVHNPLLHDVRMPSGVERGANEYFRWGGYTKGFVPEAVINPIKVGEYSVSPLEWKKR
jgi:hypothetical protein